MGFVKAVKHSAKLRMSLSGPSGSGKTYTALTLATALAGEGGSVAVIDTERGSASKYADLFNFDVMELDSFSPEKFVAGIHEAEQAGYSVVVIDSLSHAWNGTGGLLEIVDGIARRKYQGNTFAAWKDATPLQNALIDAITRAQLHVIVTMRSKQEYALERDERTGKTQPKKVGLAPIQRDGMEYEMDVAADLDVDNTLVIQKSRCSALSGQVISKPDAGVAEILKAWLDGAPAPVRMKSLQERANELYDRARKLGLFRVTSDKKANGQAFLAFCSEVLDLTITSIDQFTDKDIQVVAAYLDAKDAA